MQLIAKWLIGFALVGSAAQVAVSPPKFDVLPDRPNVPFLKNGAWLMSAYMHATGDENAVQVGKSFQLQIIGQFSDGSAHDVDSKYVLWYCCDSRERRSPGVLTVDQQGNVHGLKAGVADINAVMRIDGNIHPIYSNAWTVTVTDDKVIKGTDDDN